MYLSIYLSRSQWEGGYRWGNELELYLRFLVWMLRLMCELVWMEGCEWIMYGTHESESTRNMHRVIVTCEYDEAYV